VHGFELRRLARPEYAAYLCVGLLGPRINEFAWDVLRLGGSRLAGGSLIGLLGPGRPEYFDRHCSSVCKNSALSLARARDSDRNSFQR
jgi:hypothetical protein